MQQTATGKPVTRLRPNALNAALGFAVVLLPYSIVGPFVGTILDRVSRQRALFFANLARSVNLLLVALFVFSGATGVALTVVVLIAFGINRLILAALSAGLPLLVESKSLITANAIAVTGGSVLVVIGGGIGVGVRALVDGAALAGAVAPLEHDAHLGAGLLHPLLQPDQLGRLAQREHHAVKRFVGQLLERDLVDVGADLQVAVVALDVVVVYLPSSRLRILDLGL